MEESETLAGLRILVIEDEVIIGMMLEDMLRDFGCSVEVVPSIEKALSAIRDHALDGVLLDMNLHGQRTTAVAEELVGKSFPFLLVTGYSSGARDPPVFKAAPRLQKPFTENDLGQRMRDTFVSRSAR
jgi:CheY-like chemotaxis protein